MNECIQRHLEYLDSRAHRKLRRNLTQEEWNRVAAEIQNPALSYIQRYTRRLELFLQMETPVLLEDTNIQLIRTIIDFPEIYAPGEMDEIQKTHFVHEKGKVCNIACDYGTVLQEGLEGRRARLRSGLESASPEQIEYAGYVERTIDAAIAFADKYAQAEIANGLAAHGEMLHRVVRYGARTLLEAM